MTDLAISVEKLGKRYRIGSAADRHDSLRTALTHAVTAPFRNLVNLRRLSAFADDEEDVVWALRDVSFEVKHGEVLGIVGRNGAGKSTLLKILSRITKPTTGRARVYGRVGSLLEVGTGFHPELTGRDNVYLNGSILGMDRAYIDRRFAEIVEFSGIERFIDTPVKRYSSGMYLRLAFSVAAHLEPDILIVDEVLAVGDAAFQRKCLGRMRDVAIEGRTVLFVSHNFAAIKGLCSRAVMIESGRLAMSGLPGEVVTAYLESTFGSPHDRGLSARRDRIGGERLRMTKYEVLGVEGQVLATASCGAPMHVAVHFSSFAERLDNLRFGLAFLNRYSGEIVTELNTYYGYRKTLACSSGDYKVTFGIGRLPLAPGTYTLSIIATSGLDVLDWIKDAGPFTVGEGGFYESGRMPLPGSYPAFFMDFDVTLEAASGQCPHPVTS